MTKKKPTDTLPPLREVISVHGLGARKSLGQHFLLDLNLTAKIVSCAGDLSGCTVFEVGPGPGGLTRALLRSGAKKIIAVEKDKRCVEALAELSKKSEGLLDVVEADALKVDFAELSLPPRAIVANLPYNVGTPLLMKWLEQIENYRGMTLMFQDEVAERIIAGKGTKSYGRLSVISQFLCDVKKAMFIPARAFTPPPKVDSAVVRFVPKNISGKKARFRAMEAVTAAAFGQRRKMLRSSLRSLGGEELLKKAGICPTLRAEELSVEEFEKLAAAAFT